MEKICIISANLGGLKPMRGNANQQQSLEHDRFVFTDANFPPRLNAMTTRLQSKIPKFFGWQMAPGYDYYLWMDYSFVLSHVDSLKWFREQCEGYDIVALKHPRRRTIAEEESYVRRMMRAGSGYLLRRYENELLKDQMLEIKLDKGYVDDALLINGVFMYKNIKRVRDALKECWYHASRYTTLDQLAFIYVLRKHGLKINMLPDAFNDCKYLKHGRLR